MNKLVSIIIPAYKEPYLQQTIDSLLENAEGDIEILPVIDGPWLTTPIKKDSRVKVIQLEKNVGHRNAINMGLKNATGNFIMKFDAHAIVGKGFDRIMAENCQDNWLLIPRRYSLNDKTWTIDKTRPTRDYQYLAFPRKTDYGYGLWGVDWTSRTRERSKDHKYDIDDTMSFQGSCWFANRKYFLEHVGLLDSREETYGSSVQDPQEIGLKYWLGGGENKVIKKTWYAHLSKRKHHYDAGLFGHAYKDKQRTIPHVNWSSKHWMENSEPKMVHSIEWLINKFSPVPTWQDGWRTTWESYNL